MKRLHFALAGAAALAAAAAGTYAYATHAWNTYHWSRSTSQLTMKVGDNVTSAWDGYLQTAIADWNQSQVIEAQPASGLTNPKNCKPVSGRIEVCNSAYGYNGWLGIAQIWLSGGHITQGVTKLNDSYYKPGSRYDTPAWRAAVTCQEIGHDYGLGHQDEDFNTDATTSCMEYTNNPVGNEHPDSHDYSMLSSIYTHGHTAAFNSISASSPGRAPSEAAGGNSRADWGRAIHLNEYGTADVFEKDLGGGRKMITHVYWTLESRKSGQHEDH